MERRKSAPRFRVRTPARPHKRKPAPCPPLLVAIVQRDGKVKRIVELDDPRLTFCKEFNTYSATGHRAVPLSRRGTKGGVR